MTTTTLFASGECTDRTLPKRNPLWTPILLPGIKAWFDAELSDTALDANGNVTGALDLISGILATPLSEGGPAKVANSLNGLPTWNFASKGLAVPAQPGAGAVARCMFAIFNSADASVAATQSIMGNGESQMDYAIAPNGYPRVSGAVTAVGNVAATTGLQLFVAYADSTAAGGLKLRVNGVQVATGTAVQKDWSAAQTIGRIGAGTSLKNVAMGSFGIAMGLQTLADIQKLEGNLAQRFGPANWLPLVHPYRSKAPRKLS